MSNKVLCEHCNNMIVLPKLRRRVLKGLAYEFYFHCPECDHKYVSHYTDQKLRRDIKRQEKRWEKYRQAPTPEMQRKLLAEINTNKKLLEKDSAALKAKMQRELV